MRYLGIDLGTKRVGLSISDITATVASPFDVISFENYDELITRIIGIIEDNNIDEVVVGLPINMDGTKGESVVRTNLFIENLKNRKSIIVNTFDERLTTMEAEKILVEADVSRKKRKKVIDKLSAVIILQAYLNMRKEDNNG